MRRVAVCREPGHFTEDRGAAGFRVLILLKHESRAPFTDHKTVTVFIKRRWCEFRSLVFGAGGEKRVKRRSVRGGKLLRAARDHEVCLTVADCFSSVPNRLASGSAGGRCRNDAACDPEKETHIHGRRMRHHADIRGAVYEIRVMLQQHAAKLHDTVQTSAAGAESNTHTA